MLLGLVTAIVVGIAVPLIVPHVTHPSMIYHVSLHIASLTIAVFLSMVSLFAYTRSTGTRLLLMTLGFMALAGVELLYLLDATGTVNMFDISALNIELPHVILLAMLAMFGLGVLRVNR
jgi:hypothetical protein